MVKKQTNARNKHSARKRQRQYTKHVVASLTYVAPHKHTGKRLKHHHTSHGFLLLLLILTGIILFFSLAAFDAAGITDSDGLRVRLKVAGDPPSVGAVIKSPEDKSKMTQALAVVEGTCPQSSNIVAIYRNGLFASSRFCKTDGTFDITIQLSPGLNTLQAQNYDTLFQAGPTTSQITVSYEPIDPNATPVVNTPSDITPDKSIPSKSAAQPGKNPCDNAVAPAAQTQLGLIANCVTRNVFVGETLRMPVTLWGGVAPYALSVDWGDENKQLYSFSESGRHILSHTYLVPRIKNITLHLADAKGSSYQMETVVEINGSEESVQDASAGATLANTIVSNWIEASVPIYWAAVTLIVGFWVGDVFQRVFGIKRINRRRA